MLNKKQCNFFDEICRRPDVYRSYEELAAILQVSTRSIRNYCAAVADFAAEIGAGSLLSLQPSGLTLCATREQILCVQSHIRDSGFYAYRLSREERIVAITLMLLSSQQSVTVTQICDKLYVSRATVLNDMECTREFFQQYNVQIQNIRGYRLAVSEHERRSIVLAAVFPHLGGWNLLGGSSNMIGSLLEESFGLSTLLGQTVSVLQDTEKQYAITVNDAEFKQAVLAVALTLRRIMDGQILTQYSPERTFAANSSVQRIARSVLQALAPAIDVGEAEITDLAQRLYDCRFDKLQNFEHSIDIHLYLEIHRFLSDVESDLQCSLTEDQQLLIMLTRHIQGIQNRYCSSGDLQQFEQALVSEYRSCYDAVMPHISRIENFLGHACSYSEVCSILLHIISAMERQNRVSVRPRVCVVCHIGIGTAHFLAERLKETFNLEIAGVTSIHSLRAALQEEEFDLLISTVPLKIDGYRCVHISPSLADSDILALQAALAQVRKVLREQRKPLPHMAAPCLTGTVLPEHVVLNVPCNDWRDAVHICGAPLLAEGAIHTEYLEAVIRSVQSNGPYFVFSPHIALAHAAPTDGVERFCCSIYRPEKPVAFHHPTNDPVKLLVLIGITNVKAQIGKISALMNLLANNAVLERLLTVQDAKEIAAILNGNI